MDLEALLASLDIPDAARETALAALKREEVLAPQILTGEVTDEVRARPTSASAPLRLPSQEQNPNHRSRILITGAES